MTRPDTPAPISRRRAVAVGAALLAAALVAGLTWALWPEQVPPERPAAHLISRGVPAHASVSPETAGMANDDDYGTVWSGGVPGWLAYDLSHVPQRSRQRVLAAWSNTSYGYTTRFGPHYSNLGAYTIEVNDAGGGGEPPTTGWTTEVTVAHNVLHSRQHVLDLDGADWVRLRVTASDGSALNEGASVNVFDLYDLGDTTGPVPDDFIFYGDSITAGAMCPCPLEGTPSLPELVHEADPTRWPVMENGGDPFETSEGAVEVLLGPDGHLARFPGTYVGLSYGMNDAASGTGEDAYYTNMRRLVEAVLKAGKTPMIPTISATDQPATNAAIPGYNAVVERLYDEFPSIVEGPDLWTWFSEHPEQITPGDIHPTSVGYAALRQQWAATLLKTVLRPEDDRSTAPRVLPAPREPAPTGLHASGNQIVREDGEPVRLLGVNHSGSEYTCVGGAKAGARGTGVFEPRDWDTNRAYYDALRTWGSNTVRMGLNQACWLGADGVAAEWSGARYQAAVRRAVDTATSTGLVVVLELHWSAPGDHVPHGQAPMPDRDHTPAFWTSVADTFKGSTNVVFDLFNEPYPGWNQDTENAWRCWRDGSDPADAGNRTRCRGTEWWDTAGNAFNGGKGVTYEVAGMQELVTAVRGTGAENLVLLSGIQYANTLSHWLRWRPTDPADNLAASWHVYPFNTCSSSACWEEHVAPVASAVPVVAAEIGDEDCGTTFTAPLMEWLDDHEAAGYLAWTWNAWDCANMQLMTDYTSGTPTKTGRPVYEHFRRATGSPEEGGGS